MKEEIISKIEKALSLILRAGGEAEKINSLAPAVGEPVIASFLLYIWDNIKGERKITLFLLCTLGWRG